MPASMECFIRVPVNGAWTSVARDLCCRLMSGSSFPAGHLVGFFTHDTERIRAAGAFIAEGAACDDTSLVVATPGYRAALRAELQRLGLDPESMIARYQYIELDARTLLSQFMDGDRCDRQRFHLHLDTLMRQAVARGRPVRAHGEMVNLLAADGLTEAALQLEELWNELSREHRFTIFCGYSTCTIDSAQRFGERVRALHSHVVVDAGS